MHQVHKQCKCLLLFNECIKFLDVSNNFQQTLILFWCHNKFYSCFGTIWYLPARVRLLSDVAGGLIFSADNPLDFHDET